MNWLAANEEKEIVKVWSQLGNGILVHFGTQAASLEASTIKEKHAKYRVEMRG